MVSAPSLLQRWRPSLSPADPNVHTVTAWKTSSPRHISMVSCCKPQRAKSVLDCMKVGCPKTEGTEVCGGNQTTSSTSLQVGCLRSLHGQRVIREESLGSQREHLPGSRGKLPSGGWLAYVLGEGKLGARICVSRNAVILHSVSKRLGPAKSEAGKKAVAGTRHIFSTKMAHLSLPTVSQPRTRPV